LTPRELAAAHEAAHLLVLRKVGGKGSAYVGRNPTGLHAGAVYVADAARLTRRQRHLIAVAGAVGELMATGRMAADAMSAEDIAFCGPATEHELTVAAQAAKAMLILHDAEWQAIRRHLLAE
jgi:hypothetical protein